MNKIFVFVFLSVASALMGAEQHVILQNSNYRALFTVPGDAFPDIHLNAHFGANNDMYCVDVAGVVCCVLGTATLSAICPVAHFGVMAAVHNFAGNIEFMVDRPQQEHMD